MEIAVLNRIDCEHCTLKSEVFKTLKCNEMNQFKTEINTVLFNKGEYIFRQGTPASHVGFIKKGLVKIVNEGISGIFIIQLLSTSNFIGIPSVFGDKFFHTSAIALDESEICFIDRSVFLHFITTNGEFAKKMIEYSCKRELQSVGRISGLIRKQLPGRLADVLLFFANTFYNSHFFQLPLTRNELADFIGVSKKSFIRTMSEFSHDRLIEIEGRNITILEPELLERLSKLG